MPGMFEWRWDNANKEWVKVPAVVVTKRMAAVGQVIAGAHKLCWVACTASAGLSNWELSDDTDGSTAVVMECFSTARESKGLSFTPPMPFATGIWLKTFTNMTAITFGYV